MNTSQYQRLIRCVHYILAKAIDPSEPVPLVAVVFMGGSSYFSNGIHLNVIEAAEDPSLESWYDEELDPAKLFKILKLVYSPPPPLLEDCIYIQVFERVADGVVRRINRM